MGLFRIDVDRRVGIYQRSMDFGLRILKSLHAHGISNAEIIEGDQASFR